MGPTEVMVVIGGLATAISTLAGLLWNSERGRRIKAERDRDALTAILVGQAAKKDDSMAEFAEFMKHKRYD